MSWLYSQALVAAYSEATCSDGEQSVQSSGNPTQLAYLQPDKMTAFSRLSRFGMTFKPLTADRGEALLMSYLEDFRAKTFQPRGGGQELTGNEAECGEKWRGWLAKYDPASSSWKTAQCSLLEEEPESLQTLPRSGMTVDGMLLEQPTAVPRTSATESGLWRTPQAQDGMRGVYKSKQAMDAHLSRGHQLGLANQVAHRHLWPTPVKSDSQARRPSKGWKGDSDLPSVVWQVDGGIENPEKPPAQLNPMWVEWLMGWPLGWTDLKPLETDRFRLWQQQHGDY